MSGQDLLTHRQLQPPGWEKPRGYANGVSARGRIIHCAGQIGWNAECTFGSDDLVDQIAQALRNIVAVLACDGAGPEHVTNLVWYFVDKRGICHAPLRSRAGLSRGHGPQFSRHDGGAGDGAR